MFDIPFLAHEISTGKRGLGAFDTDRAGYRPQLRHQPNNFGTVPMAVTQSAAESTFVKRPTSVQIDHQNPKHARYPARSLQQRRLKDSMADGAPSHRSS